MPTMGLLTQFLIPTKKQRKFSTTPACFDQFSQQQKQAAPLKNHLKLVLIYHSRTDRP